MARNYYQKLGRFCAVCCRPGAGKRCVCGGKIVSFSAIKKAHNLTGSREEVLAAMNAIMEKRGVGKTWRIAAHFLLEAETREAAQQRILDALEGAGIETELEA